MSDELRNTGRTTRQMKNAPKKAVFVWCNNDLYYPRHLARFLNRTDLEIVSPEWISDYRWTGKKINGLVLDHAARLTDKQRALVRVVCSRIS